MEIKDIYFIAYILEGEGYFGFYKSRNSYSPMIQIQMTDSDIIHKFKILSRGTTEVTLNKKYEECKQVYSYRITGSLAIQWMLTIYTLMGDRRKSKIKEVINNWKEYEGVGRGGDKRDINKLLDNQLEQILEAKKKQLNEKETIQ